MTPSASNAAAMQAPSDGIAPEQASGANLKITTNPRPACRLAMEVEVPGGRCQASYDAALEKLCRSVRLPGFRKGKVPRPVLIQQIGPLRIRATALEELVESVSRDALRQEAIAAISRPELAEGFDGLLDRFQPGSPLTITLEMDVEPTPVLKTTRGLTAQVDVVVHDPARVDEVLEDSRRQLATMVPVEDRPAASGDVARIRFQGTFSDSGEAISGGSSDDLEVELEEGRMIDGFVEGILGMAIGESRTVSCRFPDSYPQQEAAGRQASFQITLLDLKSPELPALDDSFAQRASDQSTLAELRVQLEERLARDAENRRIATRQDALLDALVKELEVELPETLIRQEMQNLVEQTASQMARQGMDIKKLFTPDLVRGLMDSSRPEAEKQLRRRLALQALAKAESIHVDEGEINAKTKEVSLGLAERGSPDPRRLRAAVADDLLREALLAWLEEQSTILEAEASQVTNSSASATTDSAMGTSGSEAATTDQG